MNLKSKKILVTGGNGFIGTNLVKKLTDMGTSVSIFDLSSGYDIQNENHLKVFIKRKFDIIYHLAGLSGPRESNSQKSAFFKINTLSTINLFELLTKYSPMTKLIISSSRLEYGNPRYLPIDENHPTIPTSIYGISKLAATQLALIYHQKNNLDVTIFRTSNVYGPHPGSKFAGYNVVNHFIDLAKKDGVLKIFGKGDQERDYLFINDMVDALILATVKTPSGEIYNLGSGQGIKFKDMAGLLIKKIGKGKVEFSKWPDGLKVLETGSYVSNISKIKRELGFSPKVSFEEGIDRTIKNLQ